MITYRVFSDDDETNIARYLDYAGSTNRASADQPARHLQQCVPSLSEQLAIHRNRSRPLRNL